MDPFIDRRLEVISNLCTDKIQDCYILFLSMQNNENIGRQVDYNDKRLDKIAGILKSVRKSFIAREQHSQSRRTREMPKDI